MLLYAIKNLLANMVTTGGKSIVNGAEFVRPANTTAYAVGDVVGESTAAVVPIPILLARVPGGSGIITGCRLDTDKKSITPRLRVHLFNSDTATLAVDNAAWVEKFADRAKRLGYFDLPAMTTGADATNSDLSRSLDMGLRFPFQCLPDSQIVAFAFEALDAFTPASGQKFYLRLHAEVD